MSCRGITKYSIGNNAMARQAVKESQKVFLRMA